MNRKLNFSFKNIMPVLTVLVLLLSGCSVSGLLSDGNRDNHVYSGTAEADEINISSEVPGKIKEIKVNEGQRISQGTIIAVLDSSETQIKLAQSETVLKDAQNDAAKVNEGSREEEIKAANAQVEQAQSAVKQGEVLLNQAKANYDYRLKIYNDIKALYDSGFESQSNLDNVKNALDNASFSYENAKMQLLGFKAQLENAKQKLYILINGPIERDRKKAEYGSYIAENNYKLSKIAFEKYNISSDSEGVIETVNYNKGEYVSPGNSIATLLDMSSMYVKIYIPEKDLPYVSLNREVTVKSDYLKDKTIKGKIVYISPEAEFTPMNIVTKKDREKLVYAVKVKLLDNIDAIKLGMLLDVSIK